MATLTINNKSDQTICAVYITAVTSDTFRAWGDNRLGNNKIAPNETYRVWLASGGYDVLLEDCHESVLLNTNGLPIDRDQELTLTQTDVSRAVCDAYFREGKQAYQSGRYSKSLTTFQLALVCYETLGDRANEGITLIYMGFAYDDQSRYTEALKSYEHALTIIREVGDRAIEGIILTNIGVVYETQAHYIEALESYKQALVIWREVSNPANEGTTLDNIGNVYQAQGFYDQALENYKQALVIWKEVSDPTREGTTLNNIGKVYQAQGYYDQALESYEKALTIWHAIDISKGFLGSLFSFDLMANDRTNEGITLNHIGTIYQIKGRFTEALDHYERALTIYQAEGDTVGQGTTINNIGLAYEAQGRYSEALSSYQKVLTLRRMVGDLVGESATLDNIGVIYQTQGRYAEALAHYEQVLVIRRELGDRAGEGRTLTQIAAVYDDQGFYNEALRYYVSGIDILESVRGRVDNDQDRTSLVNDYTVAYDRVISLYHRQGAIDQAFEYSERGRERTFQDLLATGHVQLGDNESAALLSKEQQAYSLFQAAQNALAKARTQTPLDSDLIATLEAQLFSTKQEYQGVLAAIDARQDQLADLVPGRSHTLQPPDIQKLLDDETTLVAYWMLPDKTLAYILTADGELEIAKAHGELRLGGVTSLPVAGLQLLHHPGHVDHDGHGV
jgi:tetratricopeptide (TPR) repeat protein